MTSLLLALSLAILVVFAAAAINRLRGGGLGADRLPGHPRFYAAALFGLVASYALSDWRQGALLGLLWLLWALPAWGRWYTLGRHDRSLSGTPDALERVIERVAGRSDHLAFGARHLFAVPLLGALWLLEPNWFHLIWIVLFPLLAVLAYELPWRLWEANRSANPTALGEWGVGALLGVPLLS